MASLKELRIRINSVKSTQKITKAMQLVAASKLRRARERAEDARPYAEKMSQVMSSLRHSVQSGGSAPELMIGRDTISKVLLVVSSSNRGLCGGFNVTIAREVRKLIAELKLQGKEVSILPVGSKVYELLRKDFGHIMLPVNLDIPAKQPTYEQSKQIADQIVDAFESQACDSCILFYSKFMSAISQKVTQQQLIPLPEPEETNESSFDLAYEYEPDEQSLLNYLLPKNLAVQLYHAFLESSASEHGARMTAMDNATRNAGDMISRLTLKYNRSRQAAITTELTEIISGAEAL